MEESLLFHAPSKEEPFIILNKPRGLPSAPLEKGGMSALTLAAERFPRCLDVHGRKEIEGGLVHRLDTDTAGLLLVALTQEFYDYIQDVQERGLFIKTYSASCSRILRPDDISYPPCPAAPERAGIEYSLSSFFRHFGPGGKCVRPVTDQSSPAAVKKAGSVMYSTRVMIKSEEDGRAEVECKISRGFRHQVRCHLAWACLPVKGDRLYNPEYDGSPMEFFATGLSFPLPDGSIYSAEL